MNEQERDIKALRKVAAEYMEIANKPIQEERRKMWEEHFALKKTRVPIVTNFGTWTAWCAEEFSDDKMECKDPFYRHFERALRMQIFQYETGDDIIQDPWITMFSVRTGPPGMFGEAWGLQADIHHSGEQGGAFKTDAPIKDWSDMKKLVAPKYGIDKAATEKNYERLHKAVGDIIEVDLNNGLPLAYFGGDISTTIAYLRGLEQIMLDMYVDPDKFHELLAFLRDGILAAQDAAEAAGELTLTCSGNQTQPYTLGLERIKANSGPRKRKDLWGFMAAQEYTLISPEFHDKFLLEYQKPIMAPFGLMHYGCCEDLTKKIDILRTIPNLRSIAVTPAADVKECARQIGKDYVMSWRPNPADTVCMDWNEDRLNRVLDEGIEACSDGYYHVFLKDIETLQGETDRLKRFVEMTRNKLDS
jgi:hypothetical protein